MYTEVSPGILDTEHSLHRRLSLSSSLSDLLPTSFYGVSRDGSSSLHFFIFAPLPSGAVTLFLYDHPHQLHLCTGLEQWTKASPATTVLPLTISG